MSDLQSELQAFYQRSGFGNSIGKHTLMVPVYTGCMLVPLPNIETRRRYLKYHDLHHLMTGYSVGRIGEGEVSAWELGTGSIYVSPMLGIMNLIALSTGLILQRQRMWLAFKRGCRSKNLYKADVRGQIDANRWAGIDAVRCDKLEIKKDIAFFPLRAIEFSFYACASLFIHALLVFPAIIMRFVTDFGLGYSFFEVVKPRKRVDLF